MSLLGSRERKLVENFGLPANTSTLEAREAVYLTTEQCAALAKSLNMPVASSWDEIRAAHPTEYTKYLRACGIPA